MRVLADENISRAVVVAIEMLGHQVSWIARDRPGIADEEVEQLALIEADLLLTFDKNLAATVAKHKKCGVVLLRLGGNRPNDVAMKVTQLFEHRKDLAQTYVVLSETGVRFRVFGK